MDTSQVLPSVRGKGTHLFYWRLTVKHTVYLGVPLNVLAYHY